MPIPIATARIVFSGTVLDEIFSTGFWVNSLVNSAAQAQALADDVATSYGAHSATLRSLMCTHTTIEKVSVYGYPDGGPRADHIAEAILNSAGTSGSHVPLQHSLVATLKTGFAGARRRGRMFWPATGVPTADDHLVASGIPPNLVNGLKAIFDDLNARTPLTTVVVVSQTNGTSLPVETVSCDQRVDIQRRRADSQTTGDVTTAALA